MLVRACMWSGFPFQSLGAQAKREGNRQSFARNRRMPPLGGAEAGRRCKKQAIVSGLDIYSHSTNMQSPHKSPLMFWLEKSSWWHNHAVTKECGSSRQSFLPFQPASQEGGMETWRGILGPSMTPVRAIFELLLHCLHAGFLKEVCILLFATPASLCST